MPATSQSQRRLMGAALRCKRGGPCPPYAKKVAEGMSEEDLHDFASTKDKGLPNRKKAQRVEKALHWDAPEGQDPRRSDVRVATTGHGEYRAGRASGGTFHAYYKRHIGRKFERVGVGSSLNEVQRQAENHHATRFSKAMSYLLPEKSLGWSRKPHPHGSAFVARRGSLTYHVHPTGSGTFAASLRHPSGNSDSLGTDHRNAAHAKQVCARHYRTGEGVVSGGMSKGVGKMRACEACGHTFPVQHQQCPNCGHVNSLHWSQGGSITGKARTMKSAPRMRPCENCGMMMMSRTSKRCSKCGYANEVRKSQGGSPFQKALAVATPAQKEVALKTLIHVNRAVSAALAKARGRGA